MDTADYVIVGGGAAGCALAARLCADPETTVILLEAGPADRAPAITVPAAFASMFKGRLDWAFSTEPEAQLAGRRIFWPRGRVLGGSSSMNAQMYVRGFRVDYDGWGLPGWDWAEVLPLLRRSELNSRGSSALHGSSGPQPVSDLRDPNPLVTDLLSAAGQAGIAQVNDINALGVVPGTPDEGVSLVQVTQRAGRRVNSARAFLWPAIRATRRAGRRAALRVVTGASVQRVLFHDVFGRPRAVGVEARVGGTRRRFTATREVILSAGAIGSPHLLMLSGIGPAAELAQVGVPPLVDREDVGRHLQDHLVTTLRATVSTPISLLTVRTIVSVLRFLIAGRGPLTSNVAEGLGFIRTKNGLAAPDVELIFSPVRYFGSPGGEGPVEPNTHGVTIGVVLQQPHSEGRITLASSNPATPPRIEAGYLTDERDIPPLLHGLRVARRILGQPAFAAHKPIETLPGLATTDDEGLLEHVRTNAQTLYHPVGTCRMGADDAAVVDPELRVRGVDGLRVADASVLPRIIRGHTYAPAILVAEKAADLIRATRQEAARSASYQPPSHALT
jgi:choline dehydrogenase